MTKLYSVFPLKRYYLCTKKDNLSKRLMKEEEKKRELNQAISIRQIIKSQKDDTLDEVYILHNFTIFHVIEGEATFQVDMHQVKTKSGDLFFGYPGQRVTQLRFSSIKLCLVQIDRSFMIQLHHDVYKFRIIQPQPLRAIAIPDSIIGTLVPLESAIEKELSEARTMKIQMLSALCLQYLVWVERIYYSQIEHRTEEYPRLISDFYHLLYDHKNIEWKIDWFAKQLDVSSRHLSRVFKQVTSQQIKEVINEHRTNKAMHMLLFSEKEVKTIAYELNFKSDTYFFAFFKKEIGRTPMEFRMDSGD